MGGRACGSPGQGPRPRLKDPRNSSETLLVRLQARRFSGADDRLIPCKHWRMVLHDFLHVQRYSGCLVRALGDGFASVRRPANIGIGCSPASPETRKVLDRDATRSQPAQKGAGWPEAEREDRGAEASESIFRGRTRECDRPNNPLTFFNRARTRGGFHELLRETRRLKSTVAAEPI